MAGVELDWSNNSNHNGVKMLITSFRTGKYQHLTRLYLSGCNLSKLPDGFEILPLETLSLESNKFREVPSVLVKMISLKCLYLRKVSEKSNNVKNNTKQIWPNKVFPGRPFFEITKWIIWTNLEAKKCYIQKYLAA